MHIKPMVATLEAPPSTAVAPPADPRSFTFQMPLFRPGTQVTQNGKAEKVSHVILRRHHPHTQVQPAHDVAGRSPLR